jgi:hypothetical protein
VVPPESRQPSAITRTTDQRAYRGGHGRVRGVDQPPTRVQPLSPVPRRPSRARCVRERCGNTWRAVAPVGCKCPGERACRCERAGQEAAKSTFASKESRLTSRHCRPGRMADRPPRPRAWPRRASHHGRALAISRGLSSARKVSPRPDGARALPRVVAIALVWRRRFAITTGRASREQANSKVRGSLLVRRPSCCGRPSRPGRGCQLP